MMELSYKITKDLSIKWKRGDKYSIKYLRLDCKYMIYVNLVIDKQKERNAHEEQNYH